MGLRELQADTGVCHGIRAQCGVDSCLGEGRVRARRGDAAECDQERGDFGSDFVCEGTGDRALKRPRPSAVPPGLQILLAGVPTVKTVDLDMPSRGAGLLLCRSTRSRKPKYRLACLFQVPNLFPS